VPCPHAYAAAVEPVELRDSVVTLSTPAVADVDVIAALCQDPEIQWWTTVPSPYTRADAEHFVSEWVIGGWAEDRDCTWGIRVDGDLVGMVGLRLQPAASAEIGYWLGPGARGRGLLHRALVLVLDHAFARDGLDLERVEWQCYAGNWPSWRAAWRVGFRLEGAVRGAGLQRDRRVDAWVGTLLRDDPRRPVEDWPATAGLAGLLSDAATPG
jgi:RimJ/RimL family protein N-acetyltransferase